MRVGCVECGCDDACGSCEHVHVSVCESVWVREVQLCMCVRDERGEANSKICVRVELCSNFCQVL